MPNQSARAFAIVPQVFYRKVEIAPYRGKLFSQLIRGSGGSRRVLSLTDFIEQNFHQTTQVKQGITGSNEFFTSRIASVFSRKALLLLQEPDWTLKHPYAALIKSKQAFYVGGRTGLYYGA
jgi:hypothetical protein